MKNYNKIVEETMCKRCLEQHEEYTKHKPIDCAFKSFSNEYCEKAQILADYIAEKDKRIAELEEENKRLLSKTYQLKSLKEENSKLVDLIRQNSAVIELEVMYYGCEIEIKKLRKQLKSLPKKICDEVRKELAKTFIFRESGESEINKILNEIQAKYEKECGDVKD